MTALFRTVSVSAVLATASISSASWKQLASIPDALGVAAPFAGVSGDTLLVAGGANFPDKAPWDGGKKHWYDTVYAMDAKSGQWDTAGKLPRPLGYGVSVNFGHRMICAGGSDAERCYADAFWLDYDGAKISTTSLPDLPSPISNGCGACVGSTLYVACGQAANDSKQASAAVFAIDLSDPRAKWKAIDPLPGPGRILSTAASFGGAFYVVGGAELSEAADHSIQRKYLSDAYRYVPGEGWKRLANLPAPAVAAPSPAPTDATGFFILGGDDGSHVGFKPQAIHPGFSTLILHFNPSTGAWAKSGEVPAPRVTVPCVPWDKGFVIPSGEMRPGIRSPQVWMFTPTDGK